MPPPATVRVLLVEDDRDDARLVIDLLDDSKRAKFGVDAVETAAAALEKVKKHRYDVMLLDYRLPDQSGMDLLSEMVRLHFHIPVVLITSHGDRRLQDEALEAGVAEFLEKGTFSSDLLERTCLYAIGLHERQIRNGSESGGVGLQVQELVSLTREGASAQTSTAFQLSELRSEFKEGFGRLDVKLDQQKEEILKNIKKTPWDRVRDTAEWVTLHPVASVMLFLGLITIVVLLTLLVQVVDVEAIRALKSVG